MLTRLPKVYGVSEARTSMPTMIEAVGRGQMFIIKGTKNREALMMDADTFRSFQDAYMNLVGLIETGKILEDEEAFGTLRGVVEEEGERRFSITEVEQMIEDEEG